MPWCLIHPREGMTTGVIFIDNGKCASTTTSNILTKAVQKAGGHIGGMHTPARFVRDNYPRYFPSYYKFAIIRNPYDRFISLYIFRMGKLLGKGEYENEERIREIAARRTPLENNFQWEMVSDEHGKIIVDRLLRYEHLQDEMAKLVSDLKIPYVKVKDYNNLWLQKTHDKKPWQTYYEQQPDLWEMVTKYYDRDIKLWKSLS